MTELAQKAAIDRIRLAGAIERMVDRHQQATVDWYAAAVSIHADPEKTERMWQRMRRRRMAVTRLVESLRDHAEGAR